MQKAISRKTFFCCCSALAAAHLGKALSKGDMFNQEPSGKGSSDRPFSAQASGNGRTMATLVGGQRDGSHHRARTRNGYLPPRA